GTDVGRSAVSLTCYGTSESTAITAGPRGAPRPVRIPGPPGSGARGPVHARSPPAAVHARSSGHGPHSQPPGTVRPRCHLSVTDVAHSAARPGPSLSPAAAGSATAGSGEDQGGDADDHQHGDRDEERQPEDLHEGVRLGVHAV